MLPLDKLELFVCLSVFYYHYSHNRDVFFINLIVLTEKNKRECKSASFELREGYLYIRFKDESIVDLPEAKVHAKHCVDLCNGKITPFVIDGLDVTTNMDDEARQFFAEFEPMVKVRKSQAILVNNMQSKLLTNFFIKYHKPKNPIKVFDNLKDALDWIKTLPS